MRTTFPDSSKGVDSLDFMGDLAVFLFIPQPMSFSRYTDGTHDRQLKMAFGLE
jgi:hypothetical protein